MDGWEDTTRRAKSGLSRWEGEDEEEDVKESWDADPEPAVVEPDGIISRGRRLQLQPLPTPLVKAPTTTPLPSDWDDLGGDPTTDDKLRRKALEEESDLGLAKEVFGVGGLQSRKDFEGFAEEVLKKINECDKNSNYTAFVEQVVPLLCSHLSSVDVKRVQNAVGNLHIEKVKSEKGDRVKKPKSKMKAKLRMDEAIDYDYAAYGDEYDFM